MNKSYDIIVIGAGPGGYVAAIRAAQLGFTVACIEKEHFGGICLNWGCIPTKALLKSAEIYHTIQNAKNYGLSVKEVSFNIEDLVARSRQISKQLASGVQSLLKKNKVTSIQGHGRLQGKGKIEVLQQDGQKIILMAKHIILATGARARSLPNMEPDNHLIWSYKEALIPKILPKKLLVVGSGAIGIEFASFFQTLGSQVTVVEIKDRIVSAEDEDVSKHLKKSLEAQGMTIKIQTTVEKIEKQKDHIKVFLKTQDQCAEEIFDRMLIATGIIPNIEDIGLETTIIETMKGHIVTDQWCQTHEQGIYAIGDITAPPWLAHKASHEGIICVEKIAGLKGIHPLDPRKIPGCTYCHPQIASVGYTEKQAKEQGFSLKIGSFPFLANGKALALGEPEGFVKLIFNEKTGELLGAHMIGAEVTELIAGLTLAQTLETTEIEIMHTVFPHPTLSEMIHESVLNAYDRTIHF